MLKRALAIRQPDAKARNHARVRARTPVFRMPVHGSGGRRRHARENGIAHNGAHASLHERARVAQACARARMCARACGACIRANEACTRAQTRAFVRARARVRLRACACAGVACERRTYRASRPVVGRGSGGCRKAGNTHETCTCWHTLLHARLPEGCVRVWACVRAFVRACVLTTRSGALRRREWAMPYYLWHISHGILVMAQAGMGILVMAY